MSECKVYNLVKYQKRKEFQEIYEETQRYMAKEEEAEKMPIGLLAHVKNMIEKKEIMSDKIEVPCIWCEHHSIRHENPNMVKVAVKESSGICKECYDDTLAGTYVRIEPAINHLGES